MGMYVLFQEWLSLPPSIVLDEPNSCWLFMVRSRTIASFLKPFISVMSFILYIHKLFPNFSLCFRFFAVVLFQYQYILGRYCAKSHHYGIVTTLKLILISTVDYLNITSHKCFKTVLQTNCTTQILWKAQMLRNCSRVEQVTFDTDQFEISHGCVQHLILTDSTDTELVSIRKTIETLMFHNDKLKMIDTGNCRWHMLIFPEMQQTGNWLLLARTVSFYINQLNVALFNTAQLIVAS